MAKILIVEDDKSLSKILGDYLRSAQYTVDLVEDGDAALALLDEYPYDVIILDLTIPKIDGLEVLRTFRQSGGQARILILSGRDSVAEKEQGLDLGADDYLTKPFSIPELHARVRALLRRPVEIVNDEVTVGRVVLNSKLFSVKVDNRVVKFTPKEFALLEFFMRNTNQVFNADYLMDRLWNSDVESSIDTIKTLIHRIREKLPNEDGYPTIVTVRGIGYKLELVSSSTSSKDHTVQNSDLT